MKKVNEIIESIQSLPPFPQAAQRTMEAMEDPDCSVRDLVQIIQYDQAITADVLRICNSAYFGAKAHITSLQQAISYLGQKKLMSVILTSSSLKYFSKKTPGYDLKKGELWRHSVACALLSQILARMTNDKNHHALFTTGLLHDIGKLVLSTFVKEELNDIQKLVKQEGYSFLEAEKEILGMTHAEVGGKIASQWNFPQEITNAIAYHHKPEKFDPRDSLVPIIHLADMGCLLLGIGVGTDGLMYRGYHEVLLKLGLKEKNLEAALSNLHEDMIKAEEITRVT